MPPLGTSRHFAARRNFGRHRGIADSDNPTSRQNLWVHGLVVPSGNEGAVGLMENQLVDAFHSAIDSAARASSSGVIAVIVVSFI